MESRVKSIVEIRDFMRRAGALIDRLAPRIGRDVVAGSVRGAARAGEWDLALEELVCALRNECVPLNEADEAELVTLATYMGWPDTMLSGLAIDRADDRTDNPTDERAGS